LTESELECIAPFSSRNFLTLSYLIDS